MSFFICVNFGTVTKLREGRRWASAGDAAQNTLTKDIL